MGARQHLQIWPQAVRLLSDIEVRGADVWQSLWRMPGVDPKRTLVGAIIAFIDRKASPFILMAVIRLLISMLCALGLAFAPVAANAVANPSSGMPGCMMDGQMPMNGADHSKMDCCTPACQTAPAAALLPEQMDQAPQGYDGQLPVGTAVKELVSLTETGTDPPPRTIVS